MEPHFHGPPSCTSPLLPHAVEWGIRVSTESEDLPTFEYLDNNCAGPMADLGSIPSLRNHTSDQVISLYAPRSWISSPLLPSLPEPHPSDKPHPWHYTTSRTDGKRDGISRSVSFSITMQPTEQWWGRQLRKFCKLKSEQVVDLGPQSPPPPDQLPLPPRKLLSYDRVSRIKGRSLFRTLHHTRHPAAARSGPTRPSKARSAAPKYVASLAELIASSIHAISSPAFSTSYLHPSQRIIASPEMITRHFQKTLLYIHAKMTSESRGQYDQIDVVALLRGPSTKPAKAPTSHLIPPADYKDRIL
ncbi:hypothetical protein EDD15DRAFT_2517528 [Pisolithus albus]|nr:hypothetical protein EDD15DRAFT_2517528 [Pisolithus albus]